MKLLKLATIAAFAIAASITMAQAQSGPVASACKADIAKHCAGKPHDGSVRACLSAVKSKVSASCKTALNTTGPGKGKGKGKAN